VLSRQWVTTYRQLRHSCRASRCSRRGRHHGFLGVEVFAAGPAAELWRSAKEVRHVYRGHLPQVRKVREGPR